MDARTEDWRWAPRIYVESVRDMDPAYHIDRCQVLKAVESVCEPKELTCRFSTDRDLAAWRRADILFAGKPDVDAIRHEGDNLKLVHCIGAGVEAYSPFDWLPSGASFTNSRGVHAEKIGEFGLMAALMLNQRAPAIASNQRAHRWHRELRGVAAGQRVLIYGVGALGGALAERLAKAGFHVTGVRRSASPHPAVKRIISPDAFRSELERTDIVILACPLTDETRNLMGSREFAALPVGSALLNVARAGIVDHFALVAALRSGHLSGAILDVFDEEPLPAGSELWDVPNLMIYPHVSAAAPEGYIERCLSILCENLARAQRGEPLRNSVDASTGY